MFVFIDESGSLTREKELYFILGGFVTNYPKKTGKIFRKWQHTKFPKKLRYKNEVKFSDTGLNEKLRLKTINYFAQQDIRIFYTFLNKSNIPSQYRNKDDTETGLLYAEITGETLNLLLPTADLEFRVFRDRRQLKRLSQADFNAKLRLDLLPNLPAKALFQIESLDSSTYYNIQIADWICGALFRYYNKGKNGEEFFLTLKNNIINSRELFKNYWVEKWINKKSR